MCVTVSGSTGSAPLCESVRLNGIDIFLFGSGCIYSGQASIIWGMARGPREEVLLITPIDGNVGLRVTPPENSLSSFWIDDSSVGSSETLFTLTVGDSDEPLRNNLIMDLDLEYVMSYTGNLITQGPPVLSSLEGLFYPRLPLMVPLLDPVGVVTTV